MLSPIFEFRLDELLNAWRVHNDVRTRGGDLRELAMARQRLDEHRQLAYRTRRALNPEPSEASEALATSYCERIDETVFLFATDAAWEDQVTFSCICGDSVSPTPIT